VQIGALVAEARAGEAYAVINAADVQRRDNDDAIAALGTAGRNLGGRHRAREGFPNAFIVGLSVAEQHPRDRRVWPFVNALYAQQVDKTQRFVSRGFTIRAYINWKIR
jgi:hypothetical protein